MPGIGFPELIVILVIALLVLGPKRLPEAGRAIGKGMREFKDSINDIDPRVALEDDPVEEAQPSNRQASQAFGDEAP